MAYRRIVLQLVIVVAVLVAIVSPSVKPVKAQSSISLNVVGLDPNDKLYTGKLSVTPNGDLYTLAWDVGSQYSGVGIYDDATKTLSAGFGNEKCSVASYVVNSDGTLTGKWTPIGDAKLGSETATPVQANADDISGDYTLAGTNPDGSTYKAKLSVTKHDAVYQFSYDTGSSQYEGVGVWSGTVVAVGWGDTSCAVANYTINDSGSISGIWGMYGVDKIGIEDASVSLDGNYNIEGQNVDSSAYKGTLAIKEHGPVYQFSWNAGNSYEGIGIRQADTVSVAWGSDTCTILSFKQYGKGLLYGLWGTYGQDKLGVETAQLTSTASPDGIVGDYDINGIDLDAKTYSGTLNIAPDGDLIQMTWVINGQKSVGTGIYLKDVLAVALGDKCTVISYLVDGKNNLKGAFSILGSTKTGLETAIPQ